MNEKERLIKNTGLIALGNMGAKVISFILLPMYTSILSTEEYGTYDYIVALCAFLLPVVTLCMHEAMFRFIIESKDDNDRFKNVISHAFVAVFVGILGLSFVTIFVGLVFEVSYYLYFLIYLIANILYIFSVNLLRGKGEMQAYAVISSCKNILQIVLNVVRFDNGKAYNASSTKFDWFYSVYLKDVILRPSCYECPFAKQERYADITIADHWGHKDDEAYSLVVCNTEKGKCFVVCMDGDLIKIDKSDVHQPHMEHSCERPRIRDDFWRKYLQNGYLAVQTWIGNNTARGKVKDMAARIIYGLHLAEPIKAIIKRK